MAARRLIVGKKMAVDGDMQELVEELLVRHYDPAYLQSIKRNFDQFGEAHVLELSDISDEAFLSAAQTLHRAT